MLVVVAIIVLLLGIGLAVGPAVLSKGEEQKTRVTLANAQAVLEEYLRLTQQSAEAAFQVSGSDIPDDEGVTHLFRKVRNIKRMESMIAGSSFDEFTLIRDDEGTPNDPADDTFELRDGWDNAMFLKWKDGVGGDPANKLPDAGRAYFASKGPDGEWGDVNAADGTDADKQEADNMYSHELYE